MEKTLFYNFDKQFNTNLSENKSANMPLLNKMCEYFMNDAYELTNTNEELIKKKVELYNKICSAYGSEELALFEKYFELVEEIHSEQEKQLFTLGYLVGMEMRNEIK